MKSVVFSIRCLSSPLEFVPASVIKACNGNWHFGAHHWLANLLFLHATFSAQFKTAQMTPMLKKRDNDPADPSSCRPISKLNTISKVLERLALVTIIHQLASCNFYTIQSAYRKKRHPQRLHCWRLSVTTTKAIDCRQSTILVALD